MNAIQKYLTEVAVAAIREAAGNMVRDGEPDTRLVVDSMEELVGVLAQAATTFETQAPSTLVYAGRGNNILSVLAPEFRPASLARFDTAREANDMSDWNFADCVPYKSSQGGNPAAISPNSNDKEP